MTTNGSVYTIINGSPYSSCEYCGDLTRTYDRMVAYQGFWIRKTIEGDVVEVDDISYPSSYQKWLKILRKVLVCKKCGDEYNDKFIHNPSAYKACLMKSDKAKLTAQGKKKFTVI